MEECVKVCALSELQAGVGKMVEVNGKEIALFNIDGKVYATTNICPHQAGPLSESSIDGTEITCPWHGWVFDVKDGVSPVNPRAKIPVYQVKVDGNDVYIDI